MAGRSDPPLTSTCHYSFVGGDVSDFTSIVLRYVNNVQADADSSFFVSFASFDEHL